MKRTLKAGPAWIAFLAACFCTAVAPGQDTPKTASAKVSGAVAHSLQVWLAPERHEIRVIDRITLSESELQGKESVRFGLHAGLKIAQTGSVNACKAEGEPQEVHGVKVQYYRIAVPKKGPLQFEISYAGALHHALVAESEEYGRSFSRTPGIIAPDGVFLSAGSWWYPKFWDALVTFDMRVAAPPAWSVISQGVRDGVEHGGLEGVDPKQVRHWDCPHPMDGIYLVGGALHEYSRPTSNVTAYAFLRQREPNLANQYLEATAQYLEMYRQLLGPYPYKKFALVENFWETGYGMPSFTLLGSAVIRLPFILHSSYPHEILHNWWGNSVFVDYDKGNWCEGLTAYLADHLLKEGQGKGHEYRRNTLAKYRDYVRLGTEIKLSDFRERHSSATEAVGYGKSMMLFHMLRRRLGDEDFRKALQSFYRQYRFKRASFADVERVFSDVALQDLRGFFEQWVERKGAPELVLDSFSASGTPQAGYHVTLRLAQVQAGELYDLQVPVQITFESLEEKLQLTLPLSDSEQEYRFEVADTPVHVHVDPMFDVFRKLHVEETPPTAGQVFGASKIAIVLPFSNPGFAADSWRALADAWDHDSVDVHITTDESLKFIPGNRALWLLGSANRWATHFHENLPNVGASFSARGAMFPQQFVPLEGHSFMYVLRNPANPSLSIGWIGGSVEEAIAGLARKLPHYGKYSYLAFSGTEPTNVVKGQWAVADSPMVQDLRGGASLSVSVTPPPREPLAKPGSVFDGDKLLSHVRFLAADEQEGRGAGSAGLERSGDYIAARFKELGLEPGGDDGTFFQSWNEPGGPDGKPVKLRNVVAVLRGKKDAWKKQSVVLGAHYDHLGKGWPDVREGFAGQVHNGADDNASGVAAMLEVARLLALQLKPERTIVFVAFSGEEWGLRGSRHYVRSMSQWPIQECRAMVNLDSVGRREGRKFTVFGGGTATEWVHIVRGVGFTTSVEANTVMADVGGSDQNSFHEAGVPAIQLFSGTHADYHRPSDDVGGIEVKSLIDAATFVRETMVYLSGREKPLTSKLAGKQGAAGGSGDAGAPATGRRVSLGTVPSFADQGPGVLVDDVTPGGPAAKAGMLPGDRLLEIDGAPLANLRALSDVLKKHGPGDTVTLVVQRDGKRVDLTATLVAR
ncbi:MAG: M20/M25/M40 family metallo-hydrolase [Planctomycetota bacterium]